MSVITYRMTVVPCLGCEALCLLPKTVNGWARDAVVNDVKEPYVHIYIVCLFM